MHFNRVFAAAFAATLLCGAHAANANARLESCPGNPLAPAQTPIVEIDTRGSDAHGGARYGTMQYRSTAPLGPKQVALTFDDGPDPSNTKRILDILDSHCIKATFFMVGWYAKARPDLVREVAARGHTIGTHTWLHHNLRRLPEASAQREIARGFEAMEQALSTAPAQDRARLAPFFRFPGLNDKTSLITWLGTKDIATLSCDFGADDWKGIAGAQIRARALRNIASVGSGILILHDTKPQTAAMLDGLIRDLRARGYSFVQLAPKRAAPAIAETPDISSLGLRSTQ